MFDFIAEINFEKEITAGFKSPFSRLKVYETLKFNSKKIVSDHFFFQGLYEKSEIDEFHNDEIQIILYGYCMYRFEKGKTGQLNSKDIFKYYKQDFNCLMDELKGSYAIIIHDKKKSIAWIIVDPLNVRSVYFSIIKGSLYISSSATVLATLMSENNMIKSEINNSAVLEYFLFDFIVGNDTLFRGINEIPPGNFLKFRNVDHYEITQYFDPFKEFIIDNPKIPKEEAIQKLIQILKNNIQNLTDGPLLSAVSLTGGYDSRSILALMDNDYRNYHFFSYGRKKSSDLIIPRRIANKMDLNYEDILFGKNYGIDFVKNAAEAICLSDGLSDLRTYNYIYAYKNHLKGYKSIISGLFGSELMKSPSGKGSYLSQNLLEILFSHSPEKEFHSLIENRTHYLNTQFKKEHEDAVLGKLLNNVYISNDLERIPKLFYYLLMINIRKYFQRELKIERPFIENYHVFFDLDFISILFQSDFSWVNNYTKEKNLANNIILYQLYYSFIAERPTLLKYNSTHGFRPLFLKSRIFLPMLILEYFTKKKKIKRESVIDQISLVNKYLLDNNYKLINNIFINNMNFDSFDNQSKEYHKIISFDLWLKNLK